MREIVGLLGILAIFAGLGTGAMAFLALSGPSVNVIAWANLAIMCFVFGGLCMMTMWHAEK